MNFRVGSPSSEKSTMEQMEQKVNNDDVKKLVLGLYK
jgi:hypothetical protein